MTIPPLAKQVFVTVTAQLSSASMGASIAYPCVLLQQLQSNETTIHTDLDTLTWIAAMHGVSGILATFMPTVMQLKGRKLSFIGSSLILLIGWILACLANDILLIVLSAVFHGLASNCITIVNLVAISEMLAPKYRSAAMIILLMTQTIGQVLVITIGAYINWKTVAFMMGIPVAISLILVLVWPESPSWLAYKGRFGACERAFVWLRGSDEEATNELKALVAAQKEARRNNMSKKTNLRELYQKIKRRDFYLPSLHMFLILFNFYACGTMGIFVYGRDILVMVIEDTSAAIAGYVATAWICLFGCIFSFILIKMCKTKVVLSTVFGCIICLLGCSLVHYLQNIGTLPKDSLLFLYFYTCYVVCCSSGFTPVSYSLAIDLMPVKHRGLGGALFNILTCVMYVVTVKTLPYLVMYINLSWTFFMYAACSTVCTILIWIYVPETKNRTLQEIEDFYNYGTFDRVRNLNDVEVNKPIFKRSVVE